MIPMVNRIVLNTISYHGKGAIENIVPELTSRGYTKAFVCSDPDLIKFGVTKKVTDLPVSYTHLAVFIPQGLEHRGCLFYLYDLVHLPCSFSNSFTMACTVAVRPLSTRFPSTIREAVSYTHLDVYKRQGLYGIPIQAIPPLSPLG